MTSRDFVNYPVPKAAADVSYSWQEDKNPVLRGLPVVAASALLTRVGLASQLVFANAGFSTLKDIPALVGEEAVLKPRVTPVTWVPAETRPAMVPFGPAQLERQHTTQPGRFYAAADYQALYRSGAATPGDVVEALLPLVQRGQTPPSAYATAFLATDRAAVRAAAAASTARWAAGQPLGLLDGVPFSVKCDLGVAGLVRTVGMATRPDDAAFGQRYPCLRTAETTTDWPVAKLIEAGALLVAQNNMHELGMDTTGCNPATGTPVNWYNAAYYPGGSSSGAGSALGAGLVPIAVGTDAGGSVRIPTCFNGVFGLKPTHDRTMVQDSGMCVVGPMAGTAADLTAAYRIMAQPNAADPVQGSFAVSAVPGTEAPRVLGIPRAWLARSDAAVRAHFEQAVAYLVARHGFATVDVELPLLAAGQAAHAFSCLSEALAQARDRTQPDPAGWAALVNAPNRILLSTAQHASAVDLLKAGQLRAVLMRHLAHLFAAHPGLLLVTPTTPMAGWPIHPGDAAHGFTDGNMSMRAMRYVWLANTTGCPAVTCPMGYVSPAQGSGSVPLGLMALGRWGAEEQLLAWAGLVETYLHEAYPGGRVRPDQWVDVLVRAEAVKKGAEAAEETAGETAETVETAETDG